ncbi:hypothetical protein [Lysinibacillus xylanilyticus]|uniref:hypothetical protein n=1 Tax=Lysinibacillus xylanilyticus TaxID=582475 RepID=UPI0037FE0367
MRFDSSRRSEDSSINKRISRIYDDCEESCNNKKVNRGVQVPQEPLAQGFQGLLISMIQLNKFS